jgi:hypothetical protein
MKTNTNKRKKRYLESHSRDIMKKKRKKMNLWKSYKTDTLKKMNMRLLKK